MSGSGLGEVLPPPAPAGADPTFTMTVFWEEDGLIGVYDEVVSFEPQTNVYLAITREGRRIAVPYGKVVKIEVMPDG